MTDLQELPADAEVLTTVQSSPFGDYLGVTAAVDPSAKTTTFLGDCAHVLTDAATGWAARVDIAPSALVEDLFLEPGSALAQRFLQSADAKIAPDAGEGEAE